LNEASLKEFQTKKTAQRTVDNTMEMILT